ncbi:unnamed protein product [Rhizoctonia solani]|uniref:F-box domain-containing protein n=1 Tax=Rhizoctonia solani TaxID=456999 RepID=A0A8H3CYE6_9AGAM|nr:unnamed protein product [Rhizoctonia solani]
MVALSDLPPECIIYILLFLVPHEIARCNMVSRSLWKIINHSPSLQYLLELERLGFMAPHSSSNRLSLDEKVQVLKEKRLRMNTSDPTAMSLNTYDYKHVIAPKFSRSYMSHGVLALDGQNEPNQLGIYQLSSRNRDIGFDHYTLDSLPPHQAIAFEPAFDLLVLYDSTDDGEIFHLRSLRTGLPHPATTLPRVFYAGDNATGSRVAQIDNPVVIIGRRIAFVRCFTNSPESIIKIWEWTSGDTISSTKVLGSSFAFLSEDVFVVRTPLSWTSQSTLPLVVYTCDGIPPGGHARLLARFHLPESRNTTVLHSTELLPASTSPVCHCDALLTSPSLIYDLSPASYYLALNVSLLTGSGGGPGTLFIHSSSLLELACSLNTQLNNDAEASVPWSEWGFITSWIGPPDLKTASEYGPGIFGHLASFMHADEQMNVWRVEVYDLRTTTTTPSELPPKETSHFPRNQEAASFFGDSPRPLKNPALVKSFTIPFETIPSKRAWNPARYRRPMEIMTDDEHVVILLLYIPGAIRY